jgi:hypothetical protein
LGNGFEETDAGMGIPASIISVRYRTEELPDCVGLVRYLTRSSNVTFLYSGTGLTECRTVPHSGILEIPAELKA